MYFPDAALNNLSFSVWISSWLDWSVKTYEISWSNIKSTDWFSDYLKTL